jgi:succinoglycan biosynthesis transport protein ExoP
MFQNPKGFAPSIAVTSEGQARPPAILSQIGGIDWTFAWRGRRWILVSIFAALLLTLVVEVAITPRYRAVSEILIGPADLMLVDKSVMPSSSTAEANVLQVESETRVLTSDSVLRRVVDSEHLIADPEFQPHGVSPSEMIVTALRWIVALKPKPPQPGDAELAVLRQLQRMVTAKRTERTYVVDLIVETTSPEKSARIANAVVQAYLSVQAAARAEAARRATESLSARLSELRERVRSSEEQVERYRAEQGIIGPSGRTVDEQQLTELNNQLTAAHARAAEAKAKYEQVVRLERNGGDRGGVTEAVQSTTIGLLRQQYAAAVEREATLMSELGPQHPYVLDARAQVRNAQRLITEELARIAEAASNDYQRARANEESLTGSLAALKRRATDTSLAFVKLRELEREAEASRVVYESYLGRARETREQERLDTVNVRILSDAQPPLERSFPPRRMLLLLAGLILGTLGGVGLAYLADLFRRRLDPAAPATVAMTRAA